MKKFLAGVVLAVLMGLGFAGGAKALADPLGRIRSYEITCDTTARRLSPTSGYVPTSAFKMTVGATQIFVGGSDVNATTAGFPYAASSSESFDVTPGVVWCRTSAGSSVVEIIAGTKG